MCSSDLASEILRQLSQSGRKTLIFTQYEDTADLLFRTLSVQTGLRIVLYPFDDASEEGNKTLEVLQQFREDAEIVGMVCTENASEGLNLQFADSMINFDLPWDPMKLEQRIGRIQRLGQSSPKVYIYNLFLQDTVEEDVLDVLEKKIEMFGETIGKVEEILGNLSEEESFEQVFLDMFLETEDHSKKIDIMVSHSKESTGGEQILEELFGSPAPISSNADDQPKKSSKCPQCNTELLPGVQFCDNCGIQLIPGNITIRKCVSRCPQCNTELLSGAQFCDNCGVQIGRASCRERV